MDRRDLGIYGLHRDYALRYADRGDWEMFLTHAAKAAHTAWTKQLAIPFSLWSDAELEGKLRDLGALARAGIPSTKPTSPRALAFVASTLYDMGGHSETLRIWSELLREEFPRQAVILTGGLNLEHRFPHLEARLREKGLEIVRMDHRQAFTARLRALLEMLAGGGYVCALFFIHPDDALAAAAAYGCSGNPPAVFFNHADIDFWLGTSCCERYVDYRSLGAAHSVKARGVRSTRVIPLTSDLRRSSDIREAYGIPRDATLSLSLGSFWKSILDPDLCYFRAVSRVLERYPNHYHIFVTNPPDAETMVRMLPMDGSVSRRFTVTGPHVDVRPFYSSADFLIETFPLVGGMVRVEAMALGLPVVGFENREQPLYSSTDALEPSYPFTASDEESVERLSSAFIEDASLRSSCGAMLQERFERMFSPAVVRGKLSRLLEEAAA